MHFVSDRKGSIIRENSFQDKILAALYKTAFGRMVIKPLTLPVVSKIGGIFLDTGISKALIPSFIKSHSIHMEEYEQREYKSYNDFFQRRILPGVREIDSSPDVLISPCDSRLSVCKISPNSVFSIKNTRYTAAGLLKDKNLAERFAGGYIWIFRLCVEDYHRYIYPERGRASKSVRIPGIFHTVNPIANDYFPIYKENEREYCLIKTKNFGTLLQMEVGALFVGKIKNKPGNRIVAKGEEKGNFAFGGSTVILMTQKGKVSPDKDILINSMRGVETKVKLGEHVGVK